MKRELAASPSHASGEAGQKSRLVYQYGVLVYSRWLDGRSFGGAADATARLVEGVSQFGRIECLILAINEFAAKRTYTYGFVLPNRAV